MRVFRNRWTGFLNFLLLIEYSVDSMIAFIVQISFIEFVLWNIIKCIYCMRKDKITLRIHVLLDIKRLLLSIFSQCCLARRKWLEPWGFFFMGTLRWQNELHELRSGRTKQSPSQWGLPASWYQFTLERQKLRWYALLYL